MASDYEKLMAEFGYNANPMDSLNQLLTGLRQMNQYQTNKATAKTENFVNVIKATNTVEGLENLTTAIDNWDMTTDNKSYSDVGDLPKLLHGQKLETLQLAQRGYDDLIGLVDKYPMEEETDYKITEDVLMKDNLFENKKLLTQIAIAKNRLLSASKLGFRPKGDLDVEALSVHAELLDEMVGKKINLLVSSGNFDIPDEDIIDFKDNFGVQMYGLNQKEFGNYLDNYRNVLSQKYTMNERLANNYYDLMVRAGQSPSGASSTKELDTVNQQLVGGGDIIGTEAMWADRYEEYRTVATKINEQNKGLFGQYVVDNDRFKELGTAEDDISTDITSYLNSQGAALEGGESTEELKEIESEIDADLDVKFKADEVSPEKEDKYYMTDYIDVEKETANIVKSNKGFAINLGNKSNAITDELRPLEKQYNTLQKEKDNDYVPLSDIDKKIDAIHKLGVTHPRYLPSKTVIAGIGGESKTREKMKELEMLMNSRSSLNSKLRQKWKSVKSRTADTFLQLSRKIKSLKSDRDNILNKFNSIISKG